MAACISAKLVPRQALEAWSAALPCPFCREVDQAAANLPRLRLGKHERNILLHGPSPDSPQGAILDPSLRTHSDRETYLRAVRKLQRAGLVHVSSQHVRLRTRARRRDGSAVQRSYVHRTLRLTPLAVELVARYRNELDLGRPIRWARHAQAAAASVRLTPIELLTPFEDSLDHSLRAFADLSDHERRSGQQLLDAIRNARATTA